MTPRRLVTLVCVAQVCAQIGAYTWPALLPEFIARWGISNADAGWLTGLFYVAYTISVPVLVTLTDRIDPRSVYLTGVGITVLSHFGFATLVDGPWGAGIARVMAGVGWAGTYMTGLKLLADRVESRVGQSAVRECSSWAQVPFEMRLGPRLGPGCRTDRSLGAALRYTLEMVQHPC